MSDYEGQGQEDMEACYDDQWFKNMEYLEAYDNAHLDAIEDEAEWDEEANRRLDIIDFDRIARENGEKPAGQWPRSDFTDLLRSYPKLRGLKTTELWALFLEYTGSIDQVIYCRRRTMEETRMFRAQGGKPFYRLATWTLTNRSLDVLEEEGYQYAFQWEEAEEKKLDKIWRSL